jgi:hypothetical protein
MPEHPVKAKHQPLISIVTATYNSSHYLEYAIRSVLASTHDNWEMIIVGDHCTDDTRQVVESFSDPRLQFFNLASNSGQQATPNNFGVARAKGEFLCFLNQDDMFLPGHLEKMLAVMEDASIDLVLARYAVIEPFDPAKKPLTYEVSNGGPALDEVNYRANRFHVASSWFMRRKVAEDVGAWRTEDQTSVPPSQDWLFRASRRGCRIFCNEEVTLVALLSGSRNKSYAQSLAAEHQAIFPILSGPTIAQDLMAKLRSHEKQRVTTLRYRAVETLYRILTPLMYVVGVHPRAPVMMLRFGRKGGFVRHWRRKTQ